MPAYPLGHDAQHAGVACLEIGCGTEYVLAGVEK